MLTPSPMPATLTQSLVLSNARATLTQSPRAALANAQTILDASPGSGARRPVSKQHRSSSLTTPWSQD